MRTPEVEPYEQNSAADENEGELVTDKNKAKQLFLRIPARMVNPCYREWSTTP